MTIHLKSREALQAINRLLESTKKNKKTKKLEFTHIYPLIPELASGLGPSLERGRVVEMLEKRKGVLIQSGKKAASICV